MRNLGRFFYAQTMRQTIEITDSMIDWIEEQGVSTAIVLALMRKYQMQENTRIKQRTGNKPTEPKCALGKNTRSPADDETMQKMRARAWKEQGIGMIEPATLPNSSEKVWLMGYFEQQYGKRRCDNDDNPTNPFED